MTLTFDVPAGAVDAKRMAAIVVDVRQESAVRSRTVRRLLPVVALVAAALLAITGQWFVAAALAVAGVTLVAVPVVGRRQVAIAIRNQRSLAGAHTLVLDEHGTTFTGPGAEVRVSWSRYRRAFDTGDHLALQEDNDVLQLAPWAHLVEPVTPPDALQQIQAWLSAAETPRA